MCSVFHIDIPYFTLQFGKYFGYFDRNLILVFRVNTFKKITYPSREFCNVFYFFQIQCQKGQSIRNAVSSIVDEFSLSDPKFYLAGSLAIVESETDVVYLYDNVLIIEEHHRPTVRDSAGMCFWWLLRTLRPLSVLHFYSLHFSYLCDMKLYAVLTAKCNPLVRALVFLIAFPRKYNERVFLRPFAAKSADPSENFASPSKPCHFKFFPGKLSWKFPRMWWSLHKTPEKFEFIRFLSKINPTMWKKKET